MPNYALTLGLACLTYVCALAPTSELASNLQSIPNLGQTARITANDDTFALRSFSATRTAPLIVDLHQWSSGPGNSFGNDYRLDVAVMGRGWNYIRPALGSNDTPAGCCSTSSMLRITAAIDYAKSQGPVDDASVFIVGASGGAYLGLCALMNDTPGIAAYDLWVPISDLAAWHDQTRGTRYAQDIRACTGSPSALDIAEANRRSPLFMAMPKHLPPTMIYSGIRDGWQGSVPISQSVRMFNRLAIETGHAEAAIDDTKLLDLFERRGEPGYISTAPSSLPFQHLVRSAGDISLVLFEGTHEGYSAQVLHDIDARLAGSL